MSVYTEIVPIDYPIVAERQSAKRHYGVHPYFTRRPHNVVRKYILHYSQEHDRVLDPFGGSGVTAIEAFLENRQAIQNDINPLANFIAANIANLAQGSVYDLRHGIVSLSQTCEVRLEEIACLEEMQLRALLSHTRLPENIKLPRSSDVAEYYDLFSQKQLASLAILKSDIDKIEDANVKSGLLLAWSASLSKLNKTFISTEGRLESRGGSSIFSIYRYKVAKEPIELPPWKTFQERADNVIAAKEEIQRAIALKTATKGWSGSFEARAQDVDALSADLRETVDYIFTDPPYGGHISYLDLSVLWNNWLGLTPSLATREKEIIVGGDLKFTEQEYISRLHLSIRACVRMLKWDRWLSVVFQHWNLGYFEAILSAAAAEGAELRAAVSQVGDPIWSMHKKKNKETVLAGELILTFYKSGNRSKRKEGGKFDLAEALRRILAESNNRVYGEEIFNKVVVEAWNHSALGSLNISRSEFIHLIEDSGWHYDSDNHYWVNAQSIQPSLFV